MRRTLLLLVVAVFTLGKGFAQTDGNLPHYMTAEEKTRAHLIGKDFVETDPPSGEVRAIAEYEPMESVMVRYPLGIPVDLVATFSQDILVTTIVSGSTQEQNAIDDFTAAGANMDNITFIYAATDSYWVRDYGPWYIEFGDQEIGIVDFPYNRPRPNDDELPIIVADSLDLPLFGMNLTHTGGNYMASGSTQGASTELVIEENDYSVEEINELVADYLGIDEYHLNEDPLDDYIDHIDCWGKFIDVDKIIIGQVPESDYRYDDFEAVADYYANEISDYGTPYQVFRVYTPGDYPYTPYSNSLILNNRVFVPNTGSQYDDDAIEVYEAAMPGYEIIGVDFNTWENTDALHCRTHEMADREMLRIKHMPILGDVDSRSTYTIEADIVAFSGEVIYGDSVKVYYRFSETGSYSYTQMTNTSGSTYQAELDVPEDVEEVYYYIHAADASGRSENHPYIGAADPHDFYPAASAVADINVDISALEATAMVDLTDAETIQISNEGVAALEYAISFTYNTGEGWASASTTSNALATGEADDIVITFDASDMAVDTYTGNMVISSNDPDEEEVIIPMTFVVTVNTPVINIEKSLVSVYPNPFQDELNIVVGDVEGTIQAVNIYDLKGALLTTFDASDMIEYTIRWDATDLRGQTVPNGIFLIEVRTTTHRIIQKVSKL